MVAPPEVVSTRMLLIVTLDVLAEALFVHVICTVPSEPPPPQVVLAPAINAKLPLVAPVLT